MDTIPYIVPRQKYNMSHVTEEQRYTIEAMLRKGHTQKAIADAIEKDKSVVSREIKRNKDQRNGQYRSELAQRKYATRQNEKPKRIKFTDKVKLHVEKKLELRWSPEQISSTMEKECHLKVSHERIYQHVIENKKNGGKLHTFLRRRKKYRKRLGYKDRRGKIKGQKSIKERPIEVEEKMRVGDLEVDLVIGSNHKGALVTINDRRTGYAKIKLVKSKDSKEVAKAIVKALMPYKAILHTITSDNGKEFSEHQYISEKLGIDFYFAEPYSSWQRGANENLNGLVRQYFPKKSSFEELTWREVKRVENELNKRPRKRLNYETPKNEFKLLTKVAFAA